MRFHLLMPLDPSVKLENHKPFLLQQLPNRLLNSKHRYFKVHERVGTNGTMEKYISGVYFPTIKEVEAIKLICSLSNQLSNQGRYNQMLVADLRCQFPELLSAAQYPEQTPDYQLNDVPSIVSDSNFVQEGIGFPNREAHICAIVNAVVLTTRDLQWIHNAFSCLERFADIENLPLILREILSTYEANIFYLEDISFQLQDCQECD